MNDHLRPVGNPAPPRPLQSRFLDLVDDVVVALVDEKLRAVPRAALLRALEAHVMETVDIAEDAIAVVQHAR